MSREAERLEEQLARLSAWISESQRIVFFGGAGVSTESGIPDFRSSDGLYAEKRRYPPEQIVSHSFFLSHTEQFYEFYKAIYRFYNGSEVFIIVSNDEYSDMVTQMMCNVIRRTYGIHPQIIYDMDDVYSIRDDIDFSPQGAQLAYLQRKAYFKLDVKKDFEPLQVWYPFDINTYTNALE